MTERDRTPTDEELRAFDRGLLADAEADDVVHWLETHPEGEDRLRQLTERYPDPIGQALRQPCRIDAELTSLSGMAGRVIASVLAETDRGGGALAVPVSIRDYRLLGPLGQGGMGRVYRARHTRLQGDVALKLLPAHLASDPAFRARFEREMAVVGQLDHPNVIRAYDAGAAGEHLFLAMELLDGQDLARLVAGRGPLSLPDACEAVRQAALGLHHAHEHGLIHRDVKPANLFLTRTGVVKVIDLGLARVTDDTVPGAGVSTTGTIMGTPDCMAAEQWERTALDRRADLYGLGCTLFVLVTGTRPFTPANPDSWVAWMDAHRWQAPPDLRQRLPDAPAELAGLTAALLAKDPQQRPATALAVAERLAAFTAGNSLSKIDFSPAAPPGLKRRRRRLPVAAAILLAALALLLIWYFTRPGPSEQAPETPPAQVPPTTSAHAVPSLFLTGKDHVELANTAGMIDLNGAFTMEMWVQYKKGVQYLVADETWEGVGPPKIKRTHGWVLRIDNQRMNISFAVEGNSEWVGFTGAPVKFDDQWHHIAVSKDAEVLRVFLDGAAYLIVDTAKFRFVNCPLNLFLGPSNPQDPRAVNCSYRAFRVSDKQLYAAPFTPPRRLMKTADTLLLLDFGVGGGRILPDRSGKGHHGLISGGRWEH